MDLHLVRRISCCIFLSCLLTTGIQAQVVDSLKSALSETGSDVTRIKLYGLISWHLSKNSATLNEAKLYTDSLYFLSKQAGNQAGIGHSYLRYGNIEKNFGNYSRALIYLDSALSYYVPLGDSTRVADVLYDFGAIHRSMGNYAKSLPYYFRVLKISEAERNPISVASTLVSIAIVYRQLQQYDSAIKNYLEAKDILEAQNSPTCLASCLNGLGTVYSELKDYSKAREYFQQALLINTKLGNQREIAFQLSNIGRLEELAGDYTNALNHHLRAFEIRKNAPRKEDLAIAYKNVGNAHFKLNQLDKSKSYLLTGLELSEQMKTNPISRDIYQLLKEVAEAQQDYKLALGYQALYMTAKDNIINEESQKQLALVQTQFETEKHEKEILLLKQHNASQEQELTRQTMIKKTITGGLVMLALVVILLVYIYRERLRNQKALEHKNNEIQEVNYKRQLTELEMKALQAQINPHFIFNCLNSINQMILQNQNKNASKYLAKFSKLIRIILENAESSEVSLKGELQLLESYIQREALRFDGRINYRIEYRTEIDPENTYLPSMLLQPFVENAIWHGLLNKPNLEEGIIIISFELRNDQLICEIEDNGVGRQRAFDLKKSTIWKSN